MGLYDVCEVFLSQGVRENLLFLILVAPLQTFQPMVHEALKTSWFPEIV